MLPIKVLNLNIQPCIVLIYLLCHIIRPKRHVDVTLNTSHLYLVSSLKYLTFRKMSSANIHKTRYVSNGDVLAPDGCNQAIRSLFVKSATCCPCPFFKVGKEKKLSPLWSLWPLLSWDLLLQPITQQERPILTLKLNESIANSLNTTAGVPAKWQPLP